MTFAAKHKETPQGLGHYWQQALRGLNLRLALNALVGSQKGSAQRRRQGAHYPHLWVPLPEELSATSWLSDPKSAVRTYSAFSLLSGSRDPDPMGSCLISSRRLSTPHPVPTDCHQHPLTTIRRLGVGGGRLSEDSDSQEMQRQQCRPRLGTGKGVATTSLPKGPMSPQPSCS